jgi:hypothetical protein
MGSIGSIAKLIEDELGVFVYSIATGAGEYKDIWSSFYGGHPLLQSSATSNSCEQARHPCMPLMCL